MKSPLIWMLPLVALLALAGCRSGEKLDDRLLQLSLTYSIEGPRSGMMAGTTGAATGGAEVECRMADGDKPLIGATTANERGAFQMELDVSLFPERVPGVDDFQQINDLVECRPSGGEWVQPLKPPSIVIG